VQKRFLQTNSADIPDDSIEKSDAYAYAGKTPPPAYWKTTANQRNFLDWAATQLNITTFTDWYKITPKVVSPISFLTFRN
jgi:hypothetical protein